jgi:hypothetical protein
MSVFLFTPYTPIFDGCSPAAAEVLGLFGGYWRIQNEEERLHLTFAALPHFIVSLRRRVFFIFLKVDTQRDFEGSQNPEKFQKFFRRRMANGLKTEKSQKNLNSILVTNGLAEKNCRV